MYLFIPLSLRYIAPDMDFSGYIQVLFKVVSGMVMNHGAELCESNVVVRVVAVYNDPAAVIVHDSIRSGYQCQAASPSCALGGISLYDSVALLHYIIRNMCKCKASKGYKAAIRGL